jgi:hypothetical protein
MTGSSNLDSNETSLVKCYIFLPKGNVNTQSFKRKGAKPAGRRELWDPYIFLPKW